MGAGSGNKKKIFVTGARGYLGGRLIKHLLSRGHDVVGTSRSTTAKPLLWPAAVPLFGFDPFNPSNDALDELKDSWAIVHLSAANEILSSAEPERAMIDTALGTNRLLQFAMSLGVERFVFLSTVHVYGSPLAGELCETGRVSPQHPYAISHMAAEHFVTAAQLAGRIEGIVVRLSNGIGAPAWPGVDRWTLLGNDLAQQAVLKDSLTVGAPGQWRDFIPLSDVCKGLEVLLQAPRDTLLDGVFNLASGRASQVIEVARLVQRVAMDELGRRPSLS